jgi:hypothetical protein
MGLGFAAATVVELGLAAAVLVRPGRIVYAAVIAVGTALLALYAYNVFIGLPFAGRQAATAPGGAAVQSESGHAEGSDQQHDEEAAGHGEGEEHAGHHADGLVLGAGEPVDAAGATTKGAELVSIGIAIALLIRERPRRRGLAVSRR